MATSPEHLREASYLPPDVAQRLEGTRRTPAPMQLDRITSAHWEAWYALEDPPGPINPWVWRSLRRRGFHHIKLTKIELREWAGKHQRDCGQCKNTKLHGDPRHGFCATMNICVSLANRVLCEGFKP